MIEHIDNAYFLNQLYPDGLEFSGVVSEIQFSYRGPLIRLFLHSSTMPSEFPEKWPHNANHVRIELEFFEIDELNFSNWGRENQVQFIHKLVDSRHEISLEGTDCSIRFKASWISFKSISAYHTEE